MLDAVMALILPIVVLILLAAAFLVMLAPRGSFIAAVIVYLIMGMFIASAQFGGAGGCPSWRTDGFWWPVVDWPGDIYQNVVVGNISLRRYLIPKTCEAPAGQPFSG